MYFVGCKLVLHLDDIILPEFLLVKHPVFILMIQPVLHLIFLPIDIHNLLAHFINLRLESARFLYFPVFLLNKLLFSLHLHLFFRFQQSFPYLLLIHLYLVLFLLINILINFIIQFINLRFKSEFLLLLILFECLILVSSFGIN